MTRVLPWLLLTLVVFGSQTGAYEVPRSSYLYELGFYGLYPTKTFKSSPLRPPLLSFPTWDEENCSDGYYLIAQKGKLVSNPGPTIFDSRGDLVWADDSYGVVFNLQIQTYKGEDYLTFWSSPEGSSHGYGRGTYYMLDSSYEVFRKLEPVGEGLRGDLHEFQLTRRGTALMTVYDPVPADLTAVGGPAQGWALDCLVQEVDVETGDLVFEWRALEHVALADTVRAFAGEDDGTTPETAFDFFHANSVDLDAGGNYVVSGRHTSSVLCVSPAGEILWTLGGAANGFRDLSGGRATDFAYQHHARLVSSGGGDAAATATTVTLSLFDNAASERRGTSPTPRDHSRGVLVALDTANMTATLLREYADPEHPGRRADSQGSMQVLEGDGRVVLGYGWLPFVTEFAPSDGDGSRVLCAAELAPWVAARWGLVNTYRAFKARRWAGRPAAPPSAHLDPADGRVFASWNGATEVRQWVLQGAEWADLALADTAAVAGKEEGDGDGDGWTDLDVIDRDSFETALDILNDMPRYLRVAAVDGDGNVLGCTQTLDRCVGNAARDWVHDWLVWAVVLMVVLVAGVLVAARKRGRRAILGSSTRGYDLLARAASACRDRVARALTGRPAATDDHGAAYERYPAMRWWREGGDAKPHELQSVYHE
ncbi:Arylsulfotransferase-domain-containing protein [Xylaria palmicola]|nr:Arylsulfotransferase-domain-containing protein [Xylaria palmicola]